MNAKRQEELQRARVKLRALLDAVAEVRRDATATELINEVMHYGGGIGTDVADYQSVAALSLGHCLQRIDIEMAAAERAA